MQFLKKSAIIFCFILCISFLFCGCNTTTADLSSANPATEIQTEPEITAETELPTAKLGSDTATSTTSTTSPSTTADFAVTFFDVGQADSALVQCNGKNMLIDGGNVADGNTVISGLKRCGVTYLDTIIVTHSDEDHIGGIPAVLENFAVGTIYEGGNTADTKIYQKFLSTVAAKGLNITYPIPGKTFPLGDSTVTILGPTVLAANPNNNSIVLRIDYGNTAFLFVGDAMEQEEKAILATGANLKADVLKVGHHGAAESSSYQFLREIMPEYAIISVGTGNSYGHPHEAALSRLQDTGAVIFRTDLQGEIYCTSDGQTITVSASHEVTSSFSVTDTTETAKDTLTATAEKGYIGNINSKKFHLPTCPSLPQSQNAVYFATREEAVNQGYEPCGRCCP